MPGKSLATLVIRRILNDTIGIVSPDPTQADLWHQLAAMPSIAATRLHRALVIRHRASAIRHLPFAIPHSRFRDPELGSFCIKRTESIRR